MTAHTQLLVYNSENRFVGFFYQFTCRVERTKGLKDKTEFWDRLISIVEDKELVESYPSPICQQYNKVLPASVNNNVTVAKSTEGV